MQIVGSCPKCNRADVPIQVLLIRNDNEYRGRCLACGTRTEGFLLFRKEQPTPMDKATTDRM